MILTRSDIKALIDKGTIVFTPELDQFQNQPHAVDLRLGHIFYISKIWKLTAKGREILNVDVTETAGDNYEKIELKMGQYFELAPGEAIIASTMEEVCLREPNIMGVLYPRSSINRRGLSVDLTGIVDAHYCGNLMIPILNKTSSQVIRIYPGERICQIVFQKLTQDLTQNEALLHGKVAAKYHDSDGGNLASKKDDDEEILCIKSGDMKRLKSHKF
ncbi:MAG TPA: dCTP deaminase [Candidatus Gracilibacteria bacterium]